MNFTIEQLKIIHRAIRYYQTNGIPMNSKEYDICQEIVSNLFQKKSEEISSQTPLTDQTPSATLKK